MGVTHHRYLILGGGMTADAAAKGIRELDPEGTIGLIGCEPEPPYSRPPLSKALWKGEALESIWRGTAEVGADLYLGRQASALRQAGKTLAAALVGTGGSKTRHPDGGSVRC